MVQGLMLTCRVDERHGEGFTGFGRLSFIEFIKNRRDVLILELFSGCDVPSKKFCNYACKKSDGTSRQAQFSSLRISLGPINFATKSIWCLLRSYVHWKPDLRAPRGLYIFVSLIRMLLNRIYILVINHCLRPVNLVP